MKLHKFPWDQCYEGKFCIDANKFAPIGSQLNNIIGPALASNTVAIAPTARIHHVTGTLAVATITLPYPDFQGEVILIPDGAFTTVTTGNIALAITATVSRPVVCNFDGSKWYPLT